MKGEIVFINPRRGLVAVLTSHGGFTVFEALGGYSIEVGDIISGNLDSVGSEILRNETQLESMSVFIEDVYCSREKAISLLR